MTEGLEKPLRIALVGVGKIARDQHVPAIMNDPRFTLVATASREGALDGVPAYPSIEALLASGHGLDAISICTPPSGRGQIVDAATAAGMDVMMEKPPATTLREVAAMEANAAARGRVVFATWHSREAAAVAKAKEWLTGRHIQRIDIAWHEDIRLWHPGQDWILAEGGFGVFDPGVNAFSILTALLSSRIDVEAADLTIPKGRGSPISASMQMRCGAIPIQAELDFLKAGTQQWAITADTDAGPLSLTEGGHRLTVGAAVTTGPNREYPRLYAHFHDLVRARQSEMDVSPLRLVMDSLQMGQRIEAPAFSW